MKQPTTTRSQDREVPTVVGGRDLERSAQAGELIGAQLHACWRNAVMALLVDPALDDGLYVEGYAVWPDGINMPVHHGWVKLPDGGVVDPAAPVVDHGAPTYYRGAVFTAAQVRQFVIAQRRALPLADWLVHDLEEERRLVVLKCYAAIHATATPTSEEELLALRRWAGLDAHEEMEEIKEMEETDADL
jgi:hypothetical protein